MDRPARGVEGERRIRGGESNMLDVLCEFGRLSERRLSKFYQVRTRGALRHGQVVVHTSIPPSLPRNFSRQGVLQCVERVQAVRP